VCVVCVCERERENTFQLKLDVVSYTFHILSLALSLFHGTKHKELIPFLIDGIDDEDEVLLAVATSMGKINIVSTLGGFQYWNTTLLKLLELLLSIEEITVREAAIATARTLLQQIITPYTNNNNNNSTSSTPPPQAANPATTNPSHDSHTDTQSQIQQYQIQAFQDYAAMVRRLATKEWFTARISAAVLIATPEFYCHCDTEWAYPLLGLYANLCRDDTSMVRRIAAQQLGMMVHNIVQVFGRERALQNSSNNQNTTTLDDSDHSGIVLRICIPLYEEIASPEQPDSVRLQTTENCVAFGRVMSELLVPPPSTNTTTTNVGRNPKTTMANTNQQQHQPLLSLHDDEIQLLRRIIPLIVATVDDRSWRVRWTAAAKFAQVIMAYDTLSSALSSSSSSNDPHNNTLFIMDTLIPAYEKLLQDPEAEVRTAATFNLAQVAHCTSRVLLVSAPQLPLITSNHRPDGNLNNNNSNNTSGGGGVHHLAVASMAGTTNSMNHSNSLQHHSQQQQQQQQQRVSVAERLVKRITSLTEDDSEHVRAALAMVATELAPVLGKDATITYLVPPVLLLLRDAASEVRLNLMSSLSSLNEVIGVDLLSQSLLPAILDLAQDGKWRIRLAIIQHIPLLAEQLGREFFTERLTPLCVGWLGDDIASIRQAAACNLMVRYFLSCFGTAMLLRNFSLIRIVTFSVFPGRIGINEIVRHRMGDRKFAATDCTNSGT
jgi:HEAT repeat